LKFSIWRLLSLDVLTFAVLRQVGAE
jgi:hypothetical protein